jgi:uncharacterized protein
VERQICADAELSGLDSQLGALYAAAIATAGKEGLAPLRQGQRAWLQRRGQCADGECLARVYRERIATLARAQETLPAAGAREHSTPEGEALGRVERSTVDDEVHLLQTGPMVEITAVYPLLSGSGADAANRLIANLVEERLEELRRDYQRLLAQGDGDHVGPPWALDIAYEHRWQTPRLWSIGFTHYQYTGGAHGMMQHPTLVIDRQSGQRVPPSGLFRPDSDWLKVLSAYCYQALADRDLFDADDDWLREGTAPEAKNYENLLPLPDGLRVMFEQYQIGPYAIGFHEVLVPYPALADVLNPTLLPIAAGGAAR